MTIQGFTHASMCVACGPTDTTLVRMQGDFRIVRCDRCTLIYVDDCISLQSLCAFYGSGYFRSDGESVCGYRDYAADRELHLRDAHALLSLLESAVPGTGRKLLDVGCAYGFLLEAARERGWLPFGVDISSVAIQHAREKPGLFVYEGEIHDCPLEPESLDAITIRGTIEHVTDPMKLLRSAARLLKMNGVLVITTMDVEGRLGYFNWKPPEHLFYFSARSLSHLIEKAGLIAELKRTYWSLYRLSDVGGRLWAYWNLPRPGRCMKALEALGLGRVSVRIPTNEILVLARKR